MKRLSMIAFLFCFTFPLSSFNDFMDYWTVKLNGKLIYDSSKDTGRSLFFYTVSFKNVAPKDTLEVEYFTDTPCSDCIHNYFITEYTDINGEAHELLKSYLKEQKSLGPREYKISLLDIINCGSKETIKGIYYYKNGQEHARELCRINIK